MGLINSIINIITTTININILTILTIIAIIAIINQIGFEKREQFGLEEKVGIDRGRKGG